VSLISTSALAVRIDAGAEIGDEEFHMYSSMSAVVSEIRVYNGAVSAAAIDKVIKNVECTILSETTGNVLNWPRWYNAPPFTYPVKATTSFYVYSNDLWLGYLKGTLSLELTCPGACVKTCNAYFSQAECLDPAGNPDCSWDPRNGDCRQKCEYTLNEMECRADAYCEWFTNAATPKCRTACNMKYTTLKACNLDPLCEWDGYNSVCATACGQFTTPSSCNDADECTYFTGPNACAHSCENRQQTEAACHTSPECSWDRVNNLCIVKCERAGYSALDCSKNTMCTWNSGSSTCKSKCPYRYLDRINCAADSECMWDLDLGQCVTK